MKEQDQILMELAKEVRETCLEAAKDGFREASMSGLCSEGAIEAAVGSIQSVDLNKVISQYSS